MDWERSEAADMHSERVEELENKLEAIKGVCLQAKSFDIYHNQYEIVSLPSKILKILNQSLETKVKK